MKKLPEWVQDWINLPQIIYKAFKLKKQNKRNGFRILMDLTPEESKRIPYRIVIWILNH